MRTKRTLQELRKLGFETVAGHVLIGKGKERIQLKAGSDGVIFDFDKMNPKERMVIGAIFAEIDMQTEKPVRRRRRKTVEPAPEAQPETGGLDMSGEVE